MTNVRFPFNNNFVSQEFVYDISFSTSGNAAGLNVALSSSANNLSVGTDTHPGTVWLDVSRTPRLGNDFPSVHDPNSPIGTWQQVTTNCGLANDADNPGAYGTDAQVAAGNADIPAVEFNVVGGIAPGLYPGGPSQPIDFAITNPGSSSVYVGHVAIAVTSTSNEPNCLDSWYSISPNSPGLPQPEHPDRDVVLHAFGRQHLHDGEQHEPGRLPGADGKPGVHGIG